MATQGLLIQQVRSMYYRVTVVSTSCQHPDAWDNL